MQDRYLTTEEVKELYGQPDEWIHDPILTHDINAGIGKRIIIFSNSANTRARKYVIDTPISIEAKESFFKKYGFYVKSH